MNYNTAKSILQSLCTTEAKEQGGAIAQRGFSYQITCAIQLLINLHSVSDDYYIVVDHHDDIVTIGSKSRHFYQIKTKRSGTLSLSDLTRIEGSHSFSSKMYSNILRFPDSLTKCTLISNVAFKVKAKDEKKAREVERFTIGDLNKENRIEFYEHVHFANQDEIKKIDYSILVNDSIAFEQSDFNLKTHEEAIESRFIGWLEKNGYHSMVDNKWLYKLVRASIHKCAESVVGVGKSVESKVIHRSFIDSQLQSHARQGEKELIHIAASRIELEFPYTYRFDTNRILIQYLADHYNPNIEAAQELRNLVPIIIKKIIDANSKITSDRLLVGAIDADLPNRIKRHYASQQERETIILLEIIRAQRHTQPPTTSAESKKESP